MEYIRNEVEKIIDCPVYKKPKTIFIQIIEFNGKKYVRSNACDDWHLCKACDDCTKKYFNISEITSQDSQDL